MTNGKRRSTKHEKDLLSEPIVRPDGLVVGLIAQAYRADPAIEQAVWDEAMRWVDRQKVQKLLLLLERNGLSSNNPRSWFLLSLRLAEKYIKGFQVVEPSTRRPGRPKGAGRKLDRFELYKAVCAKCHEESLNVSEACRALVKTRKRPWRDHSAESLETRYYEQLAEFGALFKNEPNPFGSRSSCRTGQEKLLIRPKLTPFSTTEIPFAFIVARTVVQWGPE